MRIRITRGTVVDGRPVAAGEIVNVNVAVANLLFSYKKAVAHVEAVVDDDDQQDQVEGGEDGQDGQDQVEDDIGTKQGKPRRGRPRKHK